MQSTAVWCREQRLSPLRCLVNVSDYISFTKSTRVSHHHVESLTQARVLVDSDKFHHYACIHFLSPSFPPSLPSWLLKLKECTSVKTSHSSLELQKQRPTTAVLVFPLDIWYPVKLIPASWLSRWSSVLIREPSFPRDTQLSFHEPTMEAQLARMSGPSMAWGINVGVKWRWAALWWASVSFVEKFLEQQDSDKDRRTRPREAQT